MAEEERQRSPSEEENGTSACWGAAERPKAESMSAGLRPEKRDQVRPVPSAGRESLFYRNLISLNRTDRAGKEKNATGTKSGTAPAWGVYLRNIPAIPGCPGAADGERALRHITPNCGYAPATPHSSSLLFHSPAEPTGLSHLGHPWTLLAREDQNSPDV